MKEINTASTALLIAEREVEALIDPVLDKADPMAQHPIRCASEYYGTDSRTIKGIAMNNGIGVTPVEPCHHCGNDIDEPYMDAKVFCCREHLEEYQTDETNNENGMQAIMLDDRELAQQNVMMRIALHKLQSMTLPHEASAVVGDVLIGLARDYGVA